MAKSKVNAKIENGKVVLSKEVLDILESWKTSDKNTKLVEEYKEILLDPSNLTATKFRQHHIIPIFMFKDENHKNREKAEPLANAIEGNKIKLSIANHIIVHNLIRLIFPNCLDAKLSVFVSCRKINIENMTKNEISNIANILQNCAKENQTKEEKRIKNKLWYANNFQKISDYGKEYRKTHSVEKAKYQKEWDLLHVDDIKIHNKEYQKEHKEELTEKRKINNHQICIDPIEKDFCYFGTLKQRMFRNKEKYKNMNPRNYIIKNYKGNPTLETKKRPITWTKDKEKEYNHQYKIEHADEIAYYNNQPCVDPIKGGICKFSALKSRKYRNKEEYQNVILKDCIIKD